MNHYFDTWVNAKDVPQIKSAISQASMNTFESANSQILLRVCTAETSDIQAPDRSESRLKHEFEIALQTATIYFFSPKSIVSKSVVSPALTSTLILFSPSS